MATTKQASGQKRSHWLKVLLIVAIVLTGLGWFFRAPIAGYGQLSTAHAARNVCACRHVAGQSAGICEDNFVLGTPPVFVSLDSDASSVTASLPLIASNTATYREGYGCVLEAWDG